VNTEAATGIFWHLIGNEHEPFQSVRGVAGKAFEQGLGLVGFFIVFNILWSLNPIWMNMICRVASKANFVASGDSCQQV